MPGSYGDEMLAVFDVGEDVRDFLREVIDSGTAPRIETQRLLGQSLLAGADDWHALVGCARSIHQARPRQRRSLDGQDLLTSLWLLLSGLGDGRPAAEPWQETDRLVALAQSLERDARVLPLPASRPPRRLQSADATSHY